MVDGIITHINFEVHGCSLSQKAATVLAEHVRTMTHQQALAISDHDIQTWLNLTLGPVRLQCALAPVQALKKALEGAK